MLVLSADRLPSRRADVDIGQGRHMWLVPRSLGLLPKAVNPTQPPQRRSWIMVNITQSPHVGECWKNNTLVYIESVGIV